MILYNKFWSKMKETGVSQYRLRAEGVSNSTLTRLKRNETVSTETIDKLCRVLECRVEDIMEYIPDMK